MQVTLNSKAYMPIIGFGTYKNEGKDECVDAVAMALQTGYRHIDTAQSYKNEPFVAEGITKSQVPRKEIFLTTKLAPFNMVDEETAYNSCINSLNALGVDYVDLLLFHWPCLEWDPKKSTAQDQERRVSMWRVLERLSDEGKAKSIGVSNFSIQHLEQLLPEVRVPPAVNQVEFHPFLFETQGPLLEYCRKHNICLEAYQSLGGDNGGPLLLNHNTVKSIAAETNKTPAQVLLRWGIQHGVPVIPKSTQEERIKENFQVFDFQLSDQQMAQLNGISSMEGSKRFEQNPDEVM